MSILKRMILVSLALSSVLVIGCSSNDEGTGMRGGNSKDPNRKLSPDERWPEEGSFSYDLTGINCDTKQQFYRKADYCVTLMDREKNNNCALETRQSIYTANCGNDFDETNIQAEDWTGWDARLKLSCSTAVPPSRYIPTLTEYCVFLKNEALHSNCHWDKRFAEFKSNGCRGSFSNAP
ncbi:hypothetical protein [Bdellovibrio sp. HCB337]|uniref:hypothetical protein n=1 Tax=Bdellovibrio sp. HCB337 TaxID=3394358 RepID=UPI0039A4C621